MESMLILNNMDKFKISIQICSKISEKVKNELETKHFFYRNKVEIINSSDMNQPSFLLIETTIKNCSNLYHLIDNLILQYENN